MHVTSITLRFASFCLLFFISIQSITDIANEDAHSSLLLMSLGKDLRSSTYIQTILPYDLQYPILLLEHGNKSKQDRSYHQSVLRLFTNIFKKTPCINAYSFDECIIRIMQLLEGQTESVIAKSILHQVQLMDLEMVHRFQTTVNGLLFQSFSKQYDIFKKNPEQFLNNVSQTITNIAQEEIAIEQLRTAVIRFLEIGLSKIAWSHENFEASWHNVKSLSANLMKFLDNKIIDDPYDLDDIYWSLLTRYCYFLEIHAALIPLEFYESLEKDLDSQIPAVLSLDEQESFIESKATYFKRVLMDCKAKQSAFQHGIII